MNFESGQFGYSSNSHFLFCNAHELGFNKVIQSVTGSHWLSGFQLRKTLLGFCGCAGLPH